MGRPRTPERPRAASATGLGDVVGARMMTPGDRKRLVDRLASIAPEHPQAYNQARRYLQVHREDDRASWFASQFMDDASYRVSRRRLRSDPDRE